MMLEGGYKDMRQYGSRIGTGSRRCGWCRDTDAVPLWLRKGTTGMHCYLPSFFHEAVEVGSMTNIFLVS